MKVGRTLPRAVNYKAGQRSYQFGDCNAVKIVVWQEGDAWLGYLQQYPDFWTQSETLDEVKEHLKDLYKDLSGGAIPGARRVEDLIVS